MLEARVETGTTAEAREPIAEVIELADHDIFDVARSRDAEQEVLDLLDEPTNQVRWVAGQDWPPKHDRVFIVSRRDPDPPRALVRASHSATQKEFVRGSAAERSSAKSAGFRRRQCSRSGTRLPLR
jgi:hypothetical protein